MKKSVTVEGKTAQAVMVEGAKAIAALLVKVPAPTRLVVILENGGNGS